jgi:protease I
MAKQHLEGVRVAILVADGFEQVELTRPRRALEKHGAQVEVISLRPGSIRGVNAIFPGESVTADRTIYTARAKRYDALLIPGGLMNPDLLRQSKWVLRFVRAMDRAGKPIASLCHGPWVLISAGLVKGRRLTSWPGIRDDVVNAGGEWVDRSVVRDGNWITSRSPLDLLQFDRAIVEHFSPHLEAKGRRYPLPVGKALLGGLGVAALRYGIQRLRDEHPPTH